MTTNKTTKPFLAILAGLTAIRGVQPDAEAIGKCIGKFTAAAAKVSKPGEGTVTTGRFTGLHIMKFQDELYGHNMLAKWGFTDAELAAAWRAEYPGAKCDFAAKHHYVTSARGDLNRNRRGTKLDQLQARFGFTGDVQRFYTPVTVKAKVTKAKAKKDEPVVAPTVEPTVEPVTE